MAALGGRRPGVSSARPRYGVPPVARVPVGSAGSRISRLWAHWARPHPGDLNCDGLVNNGDIPAFVLAMTDPAAYQQKFPGCDRLRADVNGDGIVNNADIPLFVELLTQP